MTVACGAQNYEIEGNQPRRSRLMTGANVHSQVRTPRARLRAATRSDTDNNNADLYNDIHYSQG
jgi:hypothetical protein